MSELDWSGHKNGDEDLEELLRSSKAVLNDTPDDPAAGEAPPQNGKPASDFEPDFGNTFGDYGVYEGDEDAAASDPEPTKRRRHLKRFRFPTIIKVLLYIALLLAIGYFAAKFAWPCIDDVLALTRPDEEIEVVINASDDLDTIAKTLKQAGAIEYEWLFKLYCKVTKSENYFDPGVYVVKGSYDYHALVNNLMASAGNRETVKIMVIEGSDSFEIFELLEKNDVCTVEELEQAAAEHEFNYSFLESLPYGEPNRLEGYLFPDTYEFYLNDDPVNVLKKFLDNFENRVDADLLAKINESEYTLHQIVNVAAMIEAEAANDGERGNVASVIYNRLEKWDYPLLNMDSTVYYAAELEGVPFSLELDSPYNTYMYSGLPKGPICNPGLNSIRAAISPNNTDYTYFATGKDGLNRFFNNQNDFINFLNSDEFGN